MRTFITIVHIVVAALAGVGGLGAVAHRVSTYGWLDGLRVPLLIGTLGATAVGVGIRNLRGSSLGASRLGLLLCVPLFVGVAGKFDYEARALLMACVITGPIFLSSVLHALAAREATTSDSQAG